MKPSINEELTKDAFNKKKFSKPLMERRRRARINESLNELKSLVLSSLNKDHSKFNKMEKADVLELTVNYLKSLSNEQPLNEMQQQHHFVAGYKECAHEVQHYLLRSTEVNPQVKARMLSHISSSSSSPREITSRSVLSPSHSESSFTAVKPSYSPMSMYPSPPASPVYMQASTTTATTANGANTQQTLSPHRNEHRNAFHSENRASNSQENTYSGRKPLSVSNRTLWRPWQSI